jgi:tryptophan synthase alpha chain
MITEAIKCSRRAIIPYLTAGLPDMETTGMIIQSLARAGAAAIEIGIPFSDPMADGPVLQQASKQAIDAGFKMEALFEHLPGWAAVSRVPLIVMSYINPLMRNGLAYTLKRIASCGISGIIIPDEPADAGEIYKLSQDVGLDLIRLVAPTTPIERQREIVSQCRGFVYAVAVKGVTGARTLMPPELEGNVRALKSLTDLPVCVGFGVAGAAQVDAILGFADGAIVGSFLMERLMQAEDPVAAAREVMQTLG